METKVAAFCSAGLGNFINFTPVVVALNSVYLPVDLYFVKQQVPEAHEIFRGFQCVRDMYRVDADNLYEVDLGRYLFGVASIFFTEDLFNSSHSDRIFCARMRHDLHEVEANFEALIRAVRKTMREEAVPKNIPASAVTHTEEAAVTLPPNCVGIHAGWGGNRKTWERKGYFRWAEVAERLWKEGYKTVSFGTKQDRQGWESGQGNIDLIDKLSILQLGAVFKQLTGFVSADSGLAHLASAVAIPSVVLFGPTSITKNRPWGDTATVLHGGLSCSPCQFSTTWDSCTNHRCMTFDPKDVVSEVVKTLAKYDLASYKGFQEEFKCQK